MIRMAVYYRPPDDPEAFAGAVVALLRDVDQRRALGRNGRALVEERYSWPQVAREFAATCEEVVAHHAH